MNIPSLNLDMEEAKGFNLELNQQLSYIVREVNKLIQANNNNKPSEYRRPLKTYHPIKGKTDIPFRASTLKLGERDTEPEDNNVLFVDSADSKLKFKDNTGTVIILT